MDEENTIKFLKKNNVKTCRGCNEEFFCYRDSAPYCNKCFNNRNNTITKIDMGSFQLNNNMNEVMHEKIRDKQ